MVLLVFMLQCSEPQRRSWLVDANSVNKIWVHGTSGERFQQDKDMLESILRSENFMGAYGLYSNMF